MAEGLRAEGLRGRGAEGPRGREAEGMADRKADIEPKETEEPRGRGINI